MPSIPLWKPPCVYRGKLDQGAQVQYKLEAHLRQAEGRRPESASEASSMCSKCIRLEVNTCRRPYVYSPEVYINLWKDLPLQAGVNKLNTPMGLHEEGISIRSGYVIIIDPSATLYMKIQVQALALDQGM